MCNRDSSFFFFKRSGPPRESTLFPDPPLFRSVVVGSIQLYRQRRQRRLQNYLPNDYHMPISIIVPAWNEAVTVVATGHSLLNLENQAYEAIVVDDG